MDTMVRFRQSSGLALPAEIENKYGLKDGDVFQLVDLDGILILTPMTPMVPELAREIERARVEAGLTVAEMLQGLREQRERYNQEKYAR